MRFSVWPALERSWGEVLELAQRSEATGWDGFWAADHFMVEEPGESPTGVLEVWSTLAGLAAATSRITLGSLVCSVTYRHPAVLASAAVTCDHISNGRFVLGVGAGWQESVGLCEPLPYTQIGGTLGWMPRLFGTSGRCFAGTARRQGATRKRCAVRPKRFSA